MRWSRNLAYIVGLITTDGCLSNDGRHINFTSKDYEQIQNFTKILNLKNKISIKNSSFQKNKKYYYIQFSDVNLYRFLQFIGLCPNKSKIIGKLIIPNYYFVDFLRGHLDGDGFTNSYWDKRWKSSFMLYTGFVSASKNHLIWIKEKITNLYHVDGKIKYNGKSTYQLIYAKRSSIILLRKMYYNKSIYYLKRKKFKIDNAFAIIDKQAGMLELVDRHA